MGEHPFYGAELAGIHHSDFGALAEAAARRLLALLTASGLDSGTVVDLACGSGILARVLTDAGYDVVGVDISPDMVALASGNAPAGSFRCASLLDAELPAAVAVTATGDALNYAADPRTGMEQLGELARRVHDALHPEGVFLFDIATPGRAGPDGVREVFHDRETWTMHVRAEESVDRTTFHRYISLFSRTGPDTYRRRDEHHVLRLYEPADVLGTLGAGGFTARTLEAYDPMPTVPGAWTGLVVVEARPR